MLERRILAKRLGQRPYALVIDAVLGHHHLLHRLHPLPGHEGEVAVSGTVRGSTVIKPATWCTCEIKRYEEGLTDFIVVQSLSVKLVLWQLAWSKC